MVHNLWMVNINTIIVSILFQHVSITETKDYINLPMQQMGVWKYITVNMKYPTREIRYHFLLWGNSPGICPGVWAFDS